MPNLYCEVRRQDEDGFVVAVKTAYFALTAIWTKKPKTFVKPYAKNTDLFV